MPDAARDIRLNIQFVLKDGALSEPQRLGWRWASAIAARNPQLRDAVPEVCVRAHEKAVTDAGLTPEHVNDAVRIAATLYAVSLEMD